MSKASDFISGGGITPPKPAANNLMGVPLADLRDALMIPMPVTTTGEYLEALSTGLSFFDEGGNLVWGPVAASSVLAGSFYMAMYWDKVDDRLYVLVRESAGTDLIQFAWLNTTTGAITNLGGTFTNTAIDAADLNFDGCSMTRATQGVGDFKLVLSNTTGMALVDLPAAGGSATTTDSSLELVTGVAPSTKFANYRIDDDLYIGPILCPPARPWVSADRHSEFMGITLVTSLKITNNAQFTHSDGSVIGCHGFEGSAVNSLVREWGDDVVLFNRAVNNERAGAALYDKTDFHRWAVDVAKAIGARV